MASLCGVGNRSAELVASFGKVGQGLDGYLGQPTPGPLAMSETASLQGETEEAMCRDGRGN